MMSALETPEERLGELFSRGFDADSPVMHDWVSVMFELRALRRLKTHCKLCGADYAATGIEASCSCVLRAAAKALVDKLDAASDAIGTMCQMSALHGVPYTGPRYGVELDALRHELQIRP